MRAPSGKAKSGKILKSLIAETAKLWRRHHLTYDQPSYVGTTILSILGTQRATDRQGNRGESEDQETRLPALVAPFGRNDPA